MTTKPKKWEERFKRLLKIVVKEDFRENVKKLNKGEVPFFPHEIEYGLTDAWQEGYNQAIQDILNLLK